MPSAVGAASVQLSLQPSNPGVGDQVYLKIRVIDSNATPSQPASVPGFNVLFFTLSRSEHSMHTDGRNTTSTSFREYTATLRAVSEGKYSFGPISVGGVKSNRISYTIGPKSKSSAPARGAVSNPYMPQYNPVLAKAGGDDLFLRAEVSNPHPYEQEPVVYTVKLYSSYTGTQLLGSPSAPSFENCTYELSDAVDHDMREEVVNGKRYSTAVLMRYILFPTHSGKASIKGNTISFSVKQLLEFDDGSSSRIPVYQRGQVEATAPTVTLDVRPLPQSDNRINGVGDFKVRSVISKRSLTANQVATVKYIVSGSGNLAYVTLPDMASVLPQDLKFVKSESRIDKKITADNMTGTVEFTVSLIPVKDGEIELPPLRFCFFNPASGKIYDVKAPGTVFRVEKGSGETEVKENLTFDSRLMDPGRLSPRPGFLIGNTLYFLFFIVPFILIVAVLIIYRRKVRISADVVGMRRRRAGKVAQSRLRNSARFMRRGQKDAFYAETLKALWGYVAGKLNIQVAELSRDNVSGRLIQAGVSQELADRFIDVVDRCEFARYTNSEAGDMSQIYADATKVIDSLEDSISSSRKPLDTAEPSAPTPPNIPS